MKKQPKKKLRPAQHQKQQPGLESEMRPKPKFDDDQYTGSNKLKNKVAIITGGDSGIGRAISIFFAKEGADIAIIYLNEHKDANETKRLVEKESQQCLLLPGNAGDKKFCEAAVKKVMKHFSRVDILVNNAAIQFPKDDITEISVKQLEETFRTNIFSYFFMSQAVMPHLKKGSCIINSTSVTAYRGSHHLIDYASTKGAIVGFTRSLSSSLAEKGIRVNGVAPGPVWTPLIPASFPKKHVATFGSDVPMKRAAQPEEIAPCYVFLASDDASYMTGQVLHPNGGEIVNG